MENYGTTLAEAFAQKVVELYYQTAISEEITNQDYEGEIKDKASKLAILTFEKLSLHTYSGSALTADVPQESVGTLTTDQQKAYYFKIQSLSKFQSWIKNPENTLVEQCAKTLKETIDGFNLGLYTKVAAGQRKGTDYTTGTVQVTTGTGAVVGTGTTFTSAMVGRGFKAAGMTKWYRVSAYTDATHITIVDDLDDTGSAAYTGGTINAGATYTIEAVTPITESASTIYADILKLKQYLDAAKIPAGDRFLVIPSQIANYLLQASQLIPAVPAAYEDVVKKGLLGTVAGFTVYQNEQVAGDGVNGYHCLAGHKSAITYAMGYTESGVEDLIGDFGKAYKGLAIYGSKVVDSRRSALAELFAI